MNRNIYRIKGRTVYYIPNQKQGYFVPKEFEKQLPLMVNRFFFTAAFLILMINIMPDPLVACIISAAVYAGLELYYRFKFLPGLVKEKHFRPAEQKGYIASLAEKYSGMQLIIRGIGFIVFGALLVVNAYLSKFPVLILGLNGLICIVCVGMGCLCFIASAKTK